MPGIWKYLDSTNNNRKKRHLRYRPGNKVFAALGDRFSRAGKIKDISLGGLAFDYVAKRDTRNDLNRIDVFVTDNGLHISRVPCRKVYETPDPETGGRKVLPAELVVKCCGVEFQGLTEDQTGQLKTLMEASIDRT